MIGRVFNNRYQITERIGIGGMAEVYRAQDNVLGRLVAVKVMLPQYAADPSFTQRFKQEAAAAANLQSPYIVNVYDWGQDEGTYYIVMEFVRGSDLKTAIQQRGAINQRKAAEIGAQVCQALSVAHNLDIIHRDIKPQNIMVQPDGNVKVMDFGIARAKNSVMTQTSSVLGTAHYISPEQAQGKDLTATSDIYSLGIVLYEAATGKLPFDGPDAVSVAMKQVNDLPVPPREINPDIDPALEAIIMKAIAKNPADRFATAKDMRLALNDYLAGRPVNLGEGFTSAETVVMGGVVPPVGVADGTAVMPAMGGVSPASPTAAQRSYNANNTSGKKNNKKTIAIVIGIIASAVITLAGAAGLHPLLELLDTPAEILEDAYGYIIIIDFGVIVMFAYNLCAGLLRAIGNSFMPLVFLILSSVLNVILDLWFIAALGMGVAGAGVATVISQGVSVALCILYVFRSARLLLPEKKHFHVESRLYWELFSQSISMGLMSSIVSAGSVVLQYGINSLGTLVIAGHTAARKLFAFTDMPLTAMASACSTYVSQNYGANHPDRVRRGMRDIYFYGVVVAVTAILLMSVGAEWMVKLVSGSSEPVVLENGVRYLVWNAPFYAVLGMLLSTRYALQSMGEKVLPLLSSVIEFLGKIVFVLLFIPRFEYNAVILCEPVIWCFMTIELLIAYRHNSFVFPKMKK